MVRSDVSLQGVGRDDGVWCQSREAAIRGRWSREN